MIYETGPNLRQAVAQRSALFRLPCQEHNEAVTNGTSPPVCPVCGSAADVLTIRQFVDLLGAMHDDMMRRHEQYRRSPPRSRRGGDFGESGSGAESAEEEIAGVVLSAAFGLLGRAIGRRVRRRFDEQVLPALDARWQQQRQEQLAIAARYPELCGCARDQVAFLAGGSRTVSMSEVTGDLTMAQAESIVARLGGP